LTERIQEQNEYRQQGNAMAGEPDQIARSRRLTAINMGSDFEAQLGTIDWVASPQITLVPFRGKIGMFQSIYFDTDFYIFGGPAFVGLTERDKCITNPATGATCAPVPPEPPQDPANPWQMSSRTEIAPTFGLGFQFYMSKWAALGLEWRGLPVARNVGGFDKIGR